MEHKGLAGFVLDILARVVVPLVSLALVEWLKARREIAAGCERSARKKGSKKVKPSAKGSTRR